MTKGTALLEKSPKQAELKSVVSSAWLEGGKRCGSVIHNRPTLKRDYATRRCRCHSAVEKEQQAMSQLITKSTKHWTMTYSDYHHLRIQHRRWPKLRPKDNTVVLYITDDDSALRTVTGADKATDLRSCE